MTAHSDKALKTIELMNTTAADFRMVEFRWVKEERTILVESRCPVCDGDRAVLRDEAGNIRPQPTRPCYSQESSVYRANVAAKAAYREEIKKIVPSCWSTGNCPRCKVDRKTYRKTGKAMVPVQAEVEVGYPIFVEGTVFDSRFQYTGQGNCCRLCAKRVMKTNLVPVQAQGTDGKNHALYVGEDCAKKLLGIAYKLKKTQQLEIPDNA